MKTYSVLAVCGSGTVTSSMISGKLEESLGELGIKVSTVCANPNEALTLAKSGRFDFLIHTSPLQEADYGMPTINAVGFLTGFGEDEFLEEVQKVIKDMQC